MDTLGAPAAGRLRTDRLSCPPLSQYRPRAQREGPSLLSWRLVGSPFPLAKEFREEAPTAEMRAPWQVLESSPGH